MFGGIQRITKGIIPGPHCSVRPAHTTTNLFLTTYNFRFMIHFMLTEVFLFTILGDRILS